jgi:hypothetical protein
MTWATLKKRWQNHRFFYVIADQVAFNILDLFMLVNEWQA